MVRLQFITVADFLCLESGEHMKRDWFKEEKGAALAWTLIVFVVMTILATSILFIVQQDIREVVMQEKRIKTFYIAQSGVELSYAALVQTTMSILIKW